MQIWNQYTVHWNYYVKLYFSLKKTTKQESDKTKFKTVVTYFGAGSWKGHGEGAQNDLRMASLTSATLKVPGLLVASLVFILISFFVVDTLASYIPLYVSNIT